MTGKLHRKYMDIIGSSNNSKVGGERRDWVSEGDFSPNKVPWTKNRCTS
jgi:hypothetical protein